MDIIENFIVKFKKGFNSEILEYVFTQGNCYHFSAILDNLFEGGIVYNPIEGHFLFESDNMFYDITGKVNEPKHYDFLWTIAEYDTDYYIRLMADCAELTTR